MASYDRASKLLVDARPEDIVHLVLPRARAKLLGQGPTEVPAPQRTVDRLLRIRRGRQDQLLHLEIQTRWEKHVPERVAEYRMRLRFGLGQPVVSAVICLVPGGGRITSRFVEGHGAERMEVCFRVIKAWELRFTAAELRRHPGLAALAVLSHETTAERVPELERSITEAGLPAEQEADIRAAMVVLAGLRGFPKSVLRAMMEDEMIAEHPILQEIEARGEARGERRILKRQLAVQGVDVDKALALRLDQADNAAIEALAAEIVGLRSRRSVLRTIERHLGERR